MASIAEKKNKAGERIYQIRASDGRGRRVSVNWKPPETWCQNRIDTELSRLSTHLEDDLKSGKRQTAQEKRRAAQEATKLKTFYEFSESVFLPYMETARAQNTYRLYGTLLRLYAYPVWKDLPLTEINPAMISRLLLDTSTQKSYSTTKTVQACLKALFGYAVDIGALEVSPMLKTKTPRKIKDTEQEREKDLTPEELEKIFSALKEEPLEFRALVILLADSGCRRGEAVGLQWADLDVKKRSIHIHQNMVQDPGATCHAAKTKTGEERTIFLGQETIDLLRQWRQEQSKICLSPWIFTKNGTAEPLHPSLAGVLVSKFGKRAGVPGLHCHMLRHTSATLSLQAGADIRSVADRLGHADISTTLNIYAHSSEESIRRAGDLALEAMRGKA